MRIKVTMVLETEIVTIKEIKTYIPNILEDFEYKTLSIDVEEVPDHNFDKRD